MEDMMTNETDEVTIDLKNLLSDLWRGVVKFWWIGVLLAVLLGGLQYYRRYIHYVPMYQASATFTVHTQTSSTESDSGVDSYSFYYNRNTADQLQKVFPYIVSNQILQDQVCEDLGLSYMPASVSASVLPGTNMITLTTTGRDPQLTYDVLLSVVDNYSSVAEYIIGRTRLVMITAPEVPTAPYNALAWRQSVLKGVLFGLLLGFAWICLYAVMRRTIRTKEEIRTELGLSCLGVLPLVLFKKYRQKIDTDILTTNPRIGNDFLEALRLLRGTVANSLGEHKKVVMVTSTLPGEGKSVTTINLAAMYAKNTEKVLIIDCDLRNSGIRHMLQDRARTTVREQEGVYTIYHVEELGIDLLIFSDAQENGHRIMRTAFMQKILRQVQDGYDLVLLDTPPCGIISDAAILSGVADGVLYVIRQDMVLRNSIRGGINALRSNGANILGGVLTCATGGLGGYGGHYSYGGYHKYYRYGYYHRGYGYSKKYGYDKKHGYGYHA